MKIFNFLDYFYFLWREFLMFVHLKLVHGPRLFLVMPTTQLRIVKNNNSLHNISTFTKFEIRFLKIHVNLAI